MKRTDKPGWTTVSISAESRALLEQHAISELRGAIPRADGRYDVQLDDEVLAWVQRIDADIDKAIAYLCHRKQ